MLHINYRWQTTNARCFESRECIARSQGKGRGVSQQMQISLIICDRHHILKKGEITVF